MPEDWEPRNTRSAQNRGMPGIHGISDVYLGELPSLFRRIIAGCGEVLHALAKNRPNLQLSTCHLQPVKTGLRIPLQEVN